ncbi:MAG TPA: peptidoglycan DD-metalloendopeptidase family protein [Anaerolineales bacterium]|nr:peptidoglycan DD-metalloendopeptidase family protein [Anaerolineales bacterium]
MKRAYLLCLTGLLVLAGCGSPAAPAATPSATAKSQPTKTRTAQSTATASPVPNILPFQPTADLNSQATPTETPMPVVSAAPPPLPTATIGAMELFFPTVIPAAGAEYRAPLYPIPWSLSPHDHFYFAAPIAAAYPGEPIWDYRYGGIYFGPNIIHTGIDIPAPRGTSVLAAGPGTVVWAGIGLYSGSPLNTKDPYGNAVAIRHDFGYLDQPLYTIYAHMDEVDVTVGEWLNTGDVVGKVGSTGMTTGPHLHFEVRLGKNDFFFTRNPELWLAPPLGDGVLVGRVMDKYGKYLPTRIVGIKNLATDKTYNAYTYGPEVANPDDYYRENLVMSDIPAGVYELNIPYGAYNRIVDIQILPGQVTYFSFYGFLGFDFNLPAGPTAATPHP